jgi:hypothetical protein
MNLVFIAMSIGASAYLLATGMRRLRLPEPTPRMRWWWVRWLTAEGLIRPSASPSSDALDELVADLSHWGAVMRVCLGIGLVVGTILGVGIALATAGTVVSPDPDVPMVPTVPTLVGLMAGMTAAIFLHHLWHDPASNDRGVSLVQSFVRVFPGLIVVVVISAITGARLLGRLATYAYRSDDLYSHSIARDHPWTLWVLPACLAAMFTCSLSLSLRLRSLPLFRSRDPRLALAAGRGLRSRLLLLVATSNLWLGLWGGLQISSLQLRDFSLSEVMSGIQAT